MKTILVKDLQEGSIFSEDIYVDDDNLFVPKGATIREKDIKRLISLDIESVQTEGNIVANSAGYPPHRTYLELIEQLGEICEKIEANLTVKAGTINGIAERLQQAVSEQRQSFVSFILGGEVNGHILAKGLINSAILSALIAIEMKLENDKILNMIIGALLHDVGMLRIPREIVEKRGGLSPKELQRIQSHTLYTYKIVNGELGYPEDVGAIALQHHERWDGEGYPMRLSGQTIDLEARIVSVADAFEAMVSKKPYRNSMIGYQAMKNLLSDNLRRFDPDVTKAFIQIMGIYPIGSIVLLSNGAMARVEEVQTTAPLRPKIRILENDGELTDLLVEKSLFITKAVDPKEIAGKYE